MDMLSLRPLPVSPAIMSASQPPQITLPRATLALLLLWLVFYGALVAPDRGLQQRLQKRYHQQLFALEWPYYPTYLAVHGDSDIAARLTAQLRQGQWQDAVTRLEADHGFVHDLREHGRDFMDADHFAYWLDARRQHDRHQQGLISWRLGIDPQRLRPITIFTALLLWPHLSGLILGCCCLLLLAPPFEQKHGSARLLLVFFMAGGLAGIIEEFTAGHALLPISGGSAALAALLTAQIGERRWRYSLGPWHIDVPRWPVLGLALLLLLALAYATATQRIAVLSGLAAGALALPLLRQTRRPPDSDAPLPAADSDPVAAIVSSAYQEIAELRFDAARARLQAAVQQHPHDGRLLFALHPLLSLDPAAPPIALRQTLLRLARHDEELAWRLLLAHRQARGHDDPLQQPDRAAGIRLLIRLGALAEAEQMTRRTLAESGSSALLGKALLELSAAYRAQQQDYLAEHYAQLARTQMPTSSA